MTTPLEPGGNRLREPSDALLAIQLRTLFHLHRAWDHDLRAPLNNLTLTGELMRAEIDSDVDPTQLQARLKSIRESVERMTRLLESFLALHAPLQDPLERIELRAFLRELESLLAPEARRRRITIAAHLPAEDVHLQSVRDRLRHACLSASIPILEALPTGSGELELALHAEPSEIRIAMRGRRHDPPHPAASSAPGISERPSGITLEMARALLAALGGQLVAESPAAPALALTILLPRN